MFLKVLTIDSLGFHVQTMFILCNNVYGWFWAKGTIKSSYRTMDRDFFLYLIHEHEPKV